MANAKYTNKPAYQNILCVGSTGSGKTTQILTLPGKKFVYAFDPNCIASLRGFDVEYEEFSIDNLEIDATIKGFNKNARQDDRPASKVEPTTYNLWIEDINKRVENGFFEPYDWVCIDSLTFFQRSLMDRIKWINNRYGKVEELADYRICGSKISDVFRPILAMGKSIYMTGHLSTFQDELTKKITTQLNLAGSARTNLPLGCTNIWLCRSVSTEKEIKFEIQTRPESRGLQEIRSTLRGLDMYEDVTIKDFRQPEKFGIGKLLEKGE